MALPKRIKNFLEKAKIKYETVEHKTVFTAFDKAQTLKLPEKIIGKTLVLKFDRKLALVLIPANRNLDLNKIKKLVKAEKIDFASERLIKEKLKGARVGAVPPFGNFWKIKTFVDRSLSREKKIIVNGGDYNLSIKISPSDFKKLVPDLIMGSFTKARK